MRAELRYIESNDFLNWDDFVAAEREDPWDCFGWFTLTIGPEHDPGTNYFQVLISTPAAVWRTGQSCAAFKGLLIDHFEPAEITRMLHAYVTSIEAASWQAIVDQLRAVMLWEYEGMSG